MEGKVKDSGGKNSPPTFRLKRGGGRALWLSQGLRHSWRHQRPLHGCRVMGMDHRRVQKTKDYLLQNNPYPRSIQWYWELGAGDNLHSCESSFERVDLQLAHDRFLEPPDECQMISGIPEKSFPFWEMNWFTWELVGVVSENWSTTSKRGASFPGC